VQQFLFTEILSKILQTFWASKVHLEAGACTLQTVLNSSSTARAVWPCNSPSGTQKHDPEIDVYSDIFILQTFNIHTCDLTV
jgi:hypothetical protein